MTPEQPAAHKSRLETPIDDVIAEQRLTLHAGSTAYPILLQIGRPFLDGHGVGVCPIASWGLIGRTDIQGATTFHALCLGVRSLANILRSEIDRLNARVELDGEGELDDECAINAELELPDFCRPQPEDFTSHGIISILFGISQSRTTADPGGVE